MREVVRLDVGEDKWVDVCSILRGVVKRGTFQSRATGFFCSGAS